jgi:hypothetical protein
MEKGIRESMPKLAKHATAMTSAQQLMAGYINPANFGADNQSVFVSRLRYFSTRSSALQQISSELGET